MKFQWILPWLMLSFFVVAETTLIPVQSQGEIVFVSGGVGGDEREALRAVRDQYNLHLLFSVAGSGEYLSDAKLLIKDDKGHVVVDTQSNGPLLFAKLNPGHYRISAAWDGQQLEQNANVTTNRAVSLSFIWPKR